MRRPIEAGTRIVQYGYASADGQDVSEVLANQLRMSRFRDLARTA